MEALLLFSMLEKRLGNYMNSISLTVEERFPLNSLAICRSLTFNSTGMSFTKIKSVL